MSLTKAIVVNDMTNPTATITIDGFLPMLSDIFEVTISPRTLAMADRAAKTDICIVVTGAERGLMSVLLDFNFGITDDDQDRE